jgi:hypothetical protein
MSATITNVKTAKAILSAAKENNVWEAPIPTDEDALLQQASGVYDQAVAAWNGGIRGKAVTAVKVAAEVLGASEGEDFTTPDIPEEFYNPSDFKSAEVLAYIEDRESEGDVDEIQRIGRIDGRKGVQRAVDAAVARLDKEAQHENEVGAEVEHQIVKDVEDNLEPEPPNILDEAGYSKSKFKQKFEAEEFARAQARKMNLPVPEKVDDIPITTLSRNVANLTIPELAERLTDASLCLAAATWQTALAEIDEEHAERVGNHYFNIEYAKAAPNAKNVQAAQAKAEEVEEVKRWREAEAEAHSRYLAFRALKEVYKGTYDTISRVFAMKSEENGRPR